MFRAYSFVSPRPLCVARHIPPRACAQFPLIPRSVRVVALGDLTPAPLPQERGAPQGAGSALPPRLPRAGARRCGLERADANNSSERGITLLSPGMAITRSSGYVRTRRTGHLSASAWRWLYVSVCLPTVASIRKCAGRRGIRRGSREQRVSAPRRQWVGLLRPCRSGYCGGGR